MNNPFLDTSKLSDDEIFDRIKRATTHLQMQEKLGHTVLVESIKLQLDMLYQEREKRIQDAMHTDWLKQNPNHRDPIELGKNIDKPQQ